MDEETHKKNMIGLKKDAEKKISFEEVRLITIVKNQEDKIRLLIEELTKKDSLITKIKEYMGSENFNTLIQEFRK